MHMCVCERARSRGRMQSHVCAYLNVRPCSCGHERDCAFLNLGKGRFADVSAASGLAFDSDSRGAARVDWDLDGDLDLLVTARSAPRLRYLENRQSSRNRSLALKLSGARGNTDALR